MSGTPTLFDVQRTIESNERRAYREYLDAAIPEVEERLRHLRQQRDGEASTKRIRQTFRVHEADGSTRLIKPVGRDAWMLGKLIAAGARGVTTLEQPAPRTSHYIWKLRHTYGLNISSEEEAHDGPFAGSHARYRLEQRVEFISDEAADQVSS